MNRFTVAFIAAFLACSVASSTSHAQEEKKCEGDQQMCAHIADLQKSLENQKAVAEKAEASKSGAVQEEAKKKDAEAGDDAGRMIAFAATSAVVLKLVISTLTSWKGFFKTDLAKAWLKVALVVFGFLVFLATNLGFGIPWWQSLILAGGGPGSILVHEIGKLVPVLRGKKKYHEIDPDGDPTVDGEPLPVIDNGAPPANDTESKSLCRRAFLR